MSKRPIQYTRADKMTKRVKRELSKSLHKDLEEWAPSVAETASESLASSSQGFQSLNDSVNIIDSNKISSSLTAKAKSNTLISIPDSGTPLPAVQCSEEQEEVGVCGGCESSGCLCNASLFGDHNESVLELGNQNEVVPACDWIPSLHFDCDVCINCRCGACDECVHLDGELCQHCDFCRRNIDTEDESSDDASEGELETVDVDPLDEMTENERQNEEIRSDFLDIMLRNKVPQTIINDLLGFFRKFNFGDFPKCAKTLLQTPIYTKLRVVPPGLYWHRGLELDLIKFANSTGCNKIKVSFSVDGVPAIKSTGAEFYPISCSFNGSEEVFLAGVYYGVTKPASSNDFMLDFVEEMNSLVENGITSNDLNVSIEIDTCICDAVAKSWFLNVKAHSGRYSCCKCTIKGKYFGRRPAFLDLNCPMRTDESFVRQDQKQHHHGPTILTSLKTFKPVTNTVNDYMHLVLLGTLRKMVFMIIAGPFKVRQSSTVILRISNALEEMAAWVPSDLARKCRSLKYVKRFKATEWRSLLFYVGVVVFRSTLPKHLYQHFLVLSVAMRILSSPHYLRQYLSYAKELMVYFVKSYITLYGKEYTSFNIHNLLHLCFDCEIHGVVDSFSAFKFENFYQLLKKMMRKGEKPLQQLARRYEELKLKRSASASKSVSTFGGLHTNGPLPPWCSNPQYSFMQTGSKKHERLNLSQQNNCCCLEDGSIVVIENFASLKSSKKKVIVGRKFLSKESLFFVPCDSSLFGIFFATNLSSLQTWPSTLR